jgi:hypothetical protein
MGDGQECERDVQAWQMGILKRGGEKKIRDSRSFLAILSPTAILLL